jgi:hypothetical protein
MAIKIALGGFIEEPGGIKLLNPFAKLRVRQISPADEGLYRSDVQGSSSIQSLGKICVIKTIQSRAHTLLIRRMADSFRTYDPDCWISRRKPRMSRVVR